MKLKIGDTVRLKSSGPLMTVRKEHSKEEKTIECQWFEGTTLKAGVFPADSVEIEQS